MSEVNISYNFLIDKLIKNENNNIIGTINKDNNKSYLENPINLFDYFKNLATYSKSWKDCGFGIFRAEDKILQIKDKEMYKEELTEIIKEKSQKIHNELQLEFENYINNVIENTKFLVVVYKNKDKSDTYILNNSGDIIDLFKLDDFFIQYPYYLNKKDIPNYLTKYIEQDLIDMSIKHNQDIKLNILLKTCTKLSDNIVIGVQNEFRNKYNTFVFDILNSGHLIFLINHLKELDSENKGKYIDGLLKIISDTELTEENEIFCREYIQNSKELLLNIVLVDEDLQNNLINTTLISNEKREELIMYNYDLIQNLKYAYQKRINVDILKNYIEQDINNIKYINIPHILKKDKQYSIKVINNFLQQKRKANNIETINKLIKYQKKFISDYTFNHVLLSTPINSIKEIFEIKPEEKFAIRLLNKYYGMIIGVNDDLFKQSIKDMIIIFNEHNISYDVIFSKADIEDKEIIEFIDKKTGEQYIPIKEEELSKEVILQTPPPKKETALDAVDYILQMAELDNVKIEKKDNLLVSKNEESTLKEENILLDNNNNNNISSNDKNVLYVQKIIEDYKKEEKNSVQKYKTYNDLNNEYIPNGQEDPEKINNFLRNYFTNKVVDPGLLNDNYEKEIQTIEIHTMPNKIDYIDGEKIDLSGLELLIKYNTGELKLSKNYSCNKAYVNINMKAIEVICHDIDIQIPISVKDKKPVQLIITAFPEKMIYTEGEDINIKGIKVIAKYNDLTEKEITDFKYDLQDNLIFIEYQGLMTNFNIKLNKKKATNLKILQFPFKMEFIEGEQINLDGLKVAIEFNNGKYEILTNPNIQIQDKIVNISYKSLQTNFELKILPKSIIKLELLVKPYKINYIKGEKFNPDGMILTATYNNGEIKNITDIKDTPIVYSNNVTIIYNNISINIPVTITEREVQELILITNPNKLEYLKNELLDLTGLELGIKYNDDTIEKITEYDYTPKSVLSTDDKEIIIYYKKFTLTIPIKVINKFFKTKPQKNKIVKETTKDTKENFKETKEDIEKPKENIIKKIEEKPIKTTQEKIKEINNIIPKENKEDKKIKEEKKNKHSFFSKPKQEKVQKNKKDTKIENKEVAKERNIVEIIEMNTKRIKEEESAKLKEETQDKVLTSNDINNMTLNDIMDNIID